MRKILLVLALLAMVVPAVAAQSNHPPVYVFGGYQTTSTYTYYPRGLFKYDGTGAVPTVTQFAPPLGIMLNYNTVIMDWNNKDLLAATTSTSSTSSLYSDCGKILKFDPTANQWSTLASFVWQPGSSTTGYIYEYVYENMVMDQNGDVLFSNYRYDRVTSPTTTYWYTRCVMKMDRSTNLISTLLTTLQVPGMDSDYFGNLNVDIDTGKLLISCSESETTPTTIRYPVLTLNPEDGYNAANLGYWNDGSTYGWSNYSYNLPQNHRTGDLEGPYYYVSSSSTAYGRIYGLKPGSASLTTIASFPRAAYPGTSSFYMYSGKYDLQTAARPLYQANSYVSSQGDWLVGHDVLNGWQPVTVTTLMDSTLTPGYNYYYGQYNFEFLGGRHIQTTKISANKWAVLISVPHHPGKPYVCVLGLSGVRPGIALPSGRNINMNWDTLMYLTLSNMIPNLFNPGPLFLDKSGNAKASVDVNPLSPPKNGFGLPLWIGVAVLDPKAPDGVAYLPDTYVIRI